MDDGSGTETVDKFEQAELCIRPTILKRAPASAMCEDLCDTSIFGVIIQSAPSCSTLHHPTRVNVFVSIRAQY